MTALIAFDVYGTLVDPAGMVVPLAKPFGAQAVAAAQLWREKQLEFTFRRALMRRYVDFDVCTAQALSSVSAQLGVPLAEDSRAVLLAAYLRLPSFALGLSFWNGRNSWKRKSSASASANNSVSGVIFMMAYANFS